MHEHEDGFTGGSIFVHGLRVLESYLNEKPTIPKDDNKRKALQHLLEFLSSSHSELTAPKAEKGECYRAMQLAEHLLSKLTVDGSYILDQRYSKPQFDLMYEEQEKMKLKFGDTSFGVSDGWHGSSDILMNSIPVNLAGDDDDGSSVTSESSVGVKAANFQMKDVKQVIAQTIDFSFLQQRHGQNLKNSLVPSIGISKDALMIFFYDSENDVLLQSNKLPLFKEGLNHTHVFNPTIVFLWLTLNYKYFCSGVVKEMKDEKSGFFQILGDHLEKYKKEVKQPCEVVAEDEKDLFDYFSLTVKKGTTEVQIEETCELELQPEMLKL